MAADFSATTSTASKHISWRSSDCAFAAPNPTPSLHTTTGAPSFT
eukprot:CAMPEP_0194533578 /NCGR_PEP_ID=MMETSP0253-20130528/71490_1 /TAXON_ID=2966 /ORGANISM="Noctiluca scintillans" /LENGTH=44 /DNA_ID= /DNA_START= /DNA_END= /DNA_ORIENTATION=